MHSFSVSMHAVNTPQQQQQQRVRTLRTYTYNLSRRPSQAALDHNPPYAILLLTFGTMVSYFLLVVR